MAKRIGIIGSYNTGKSFSRTYIKDPESCFVINPSDKESFLRKEGKPLQELEILIDGKSYKDYAKSKGISTYKVIEAISKGKIPENRITSITGNSVYLPDLAYVGSHVYFIAKFMPKIKNLFLADFTHFISAEVTSVEFMKRSSGGQAFARYTDLASTALNSIFKSMEGLREDLLVITEFHCQMGDDGMYRIFMPAGKMLSDKFLPESYFDIMLFTKVLKYSDDIKDEKDRYKFVVTKQEPYDARSANIFNDIAERGLIPNNMEVVLNKIRKHYNI